MSSLNMPTLTAPQSPRPTQSLAVSKPTLSQEARSLTAPVSTAPRASGGPALHVDGFEAALSFNPKPFLLPPSANGNMSEFLSKGGGGSKPGLGTNGGGGIL